MHANTIRKRIRRGWDPERARSAPARPQGDRTACVNGHTRTPENTYICKNSGRLHCRTCRRVNSQRYRATKGEPNRGHSTFIPDALPSGS